MCIVLQKAVTDGEDGSESESDWGSDSESESTSSDDDGQYQNIRERFIKKYVPLIYIKNLMKIDTKENLIINVIWCNGLFGT